MSSASNHLARADLLLKRRLLPEALACFHRAERTGANPDCCSAGRWMTFALQGDLAAAWQECDAMHRRDAPDPNRFWLGEDLCGKRVILRCLHGLGDTVQFLRYAPLLRSRCAQLIVECPPPMVDLVRCLHGIDEVISWGENAPATPPAWDVQIEVMELPYLFRTTLADLPIATDYLSLPQTELSRAVCALGDYSQPRVGVVWSSGEWNLERSFPFKLLTPLLSRTDCQFWNLQGGHVRVQWHNLPHAPHLRDTASLDDTGVIPLAAVIAQLDLVITVDTLAAHLAGALNVPCWLLLQYAADWRWLVCRNDSPWYPSLRLFRQLTPGDWQGVATQLHRSLQAWMMEPSKWRYLP